MSPKTQASTQEFMAQACAMEVEAAERYTELAELMRAHNNRKVAELFTKLARIEGLHRDHIMKRMGWKEAPPPEGFQWETPEGPETTDPGELHYLMTPWHALQLALHNERRAAEFFERLANTDMPPEVCAEAAEMAEDEREHVRLIEEWIAKTPKPKPGWDEDMDPPVAVD